MKRTKRKSAIINVATTATPAIAESKTVSETEKVSSPKPLLKIINDTFNLKITKGLLEKIEYLCDRFSTVEWSGTLYYKKEGDVNLNNLTLTAIDLYLQDIGTAAYTEYEFNEEYAGFLASHPELRESDVFEGHIHSHNKMAAFFSGTDDAELIDSTMIRGNFLSLIVNNIGHYVAALGTKADAYVIQNTTYTYKNFEGEIITLSSPTEKVIPIVLKRMGIIEKENPQLTLKGIFDQIITKIQNSKQKVTYKNRDWNESFTGRLDFGNTNDTIRDSTYQKSFNNYLSTQEVNKFGLNSTKTKSVLPFETEATILLKQAIACTPLFTGSIHEAIQQIPRNLSVSDYEMIAANQFDFIWDQILDSLNYDDVLEQQLAMDKVCSTALQLISEQTSLKENIYVKIIQKFLENMLDISSMTDFPVENLNNKK